MLGFISEIHKVIRYEDHIQKKFLYRSKPNNFLRFNL